MEETLTGGSGRKSEKHRLRQELRKLLATLLPLEKRIAAEAVTARVLDLPEVQRAQRVFACLSFGAEIDTWKLVESLREAGKEIYVPRTEKGDSRVHVHRYPCPLRTLSFGLRQPGREAPEVPEGEVDGTVDVALILSLGFDRKGYRLGYGGGYFDRFLEGRPFPAVGLAYDLQLLDALPVESHDVPMDVILTEKQVLRLR